MSPASHLPFGIRTRYRVKRGIRRAHELLGDQPVFLPLQLLLTPEGYRERAVRAGTDLVIEGFPRSGNTFAVKAFQLAQRQPVVVASHVHIPAQVKLAVRRRVPALVLVRRPEDAVVSMNIADPHHRVGGLLRYWVHYHEQVLPLAGDLVVATFEQVTTDLGAVTDRVNERFGTSFDRFVHDPAAVDEVFAAIDQKQRQVHGERLYLEAVARPEPSRGEAREALLTEIESSVHDALRDRASDLHRQFVAAAT